MSNFLTRGLRQRQVHGGLDWRERMTDTIRDEWPTPMASERTLVAERGLGVTGKPYYFYVLRAVESFGLVVFVMAESEEVGWPEDARGATPFDSGGLWWRKFAADPPLDEAGRRMYFERHDVPLASWRAAFERYVRKRHTSVADYVKGNAPKAGSEPTPNDSRAWTWEVRVPHALVAGRFQVAGRLHDGG